MSKLRVPGICPELYSEGSTGASSNDDWAFGVVLVSPDGNMVTGDMVGLHNSMDEAVVKESSDDTDPISSGTGGIV